LCAQCITLVFFDLVCSNLFPGGKSKRKVGDPAPLLDITDKNSPTQFISQKEPSRVFSLRRLCQRDSGTRWLFAHSIQSRVSNKISCWYTIYRGRQGKGYLTSFKKYIQKKKLRYSITRVKPFRFKEI
jgi:hypothetical protein